MQNVGNNYEVILLRRCFYSAAIENFLKHKESHVLGELTRNNEFALEENQKRAWIEQIDILKKQLAPFGGGHLIFEYTIPRIGKRIDNVLLYNGLVYLFEFKVGESDYHSCAIEQVMDYALDLKNFHKESHDKVIIPVLIATKALAIKQTFTQYVDGIVKPILSNGYNISEMVANASDTFKESPFVPLNWENSVYMPTPTIIEAAQALYRGHNVSAISRSDSGAKNLHLTTLTINRIIDQSKTNNEKSICFVTGVPGAGKTLAGLNIANSRHCFEDEEHAVFLSGNGPLVDVLQEALARNQFEESGGKIAKNVARTKAKAFIQLIHHFRDDALSISNPPIEKVVIFDEAQRAWTLEQTSDFMRKKKGQPDFNMSEPEFLISIMDRHSDWSVIICLVGGGQEINVGEAGLPEWFNALRTRYSNWNIYICLKKSLILNIRGESI